MFLRRVQFLTGILALLSLAAGLLRGFDESIWWIDVHPLALGVAKMILGMAGIALIFVSSFQNLPRRKILLLALLPLAITSAANTATFFRLWIVGSIHPFIPIPLSLILFAISISPLVYARSSVPGAPFKWSIASATIMVLIALAAFPAAQILFFGTTDYGRQADVAVVFGAHARADGTPSDALADRVACACDLYHRGIVHQLIFSGGPGDGSIDEPHAMRAMALQLGVSDSAITLDSQGVTTAATVRNTAPLLRAMNAHRILVVSHFFHLPRIKLAYQRSRIDVQTVSAPQRRLLKSLPYLLLREVVAWWSYALRN